MKTYARILAIILSVMMILTSLPIVSLAGNIEADSAAQNPAPVEMRINSTSIASEHVAKRSENEKHFKLSDGTYIAVKYGYPVHKLNEDGAWEDINLSFSEKENVDTTTFVSQTDALTAAISDGTAIHLTDAEDASPVYLKLAGFDMTASEGSAEEKAEAEPDDEAVYRENIRIIEEAVKSPAICFEDASKGIGLAYERAYSSIRQNIVIDYEIENNSFSFELNTGDLTAVLNDSGSVEIRDEDEVKYIIPVPYMHDSENKLFSILSYLLEETDDGGYILSINVGNELTENEEISYPVTITTAVTASYEETVSMTSVSSDAPDMSYIGGNIQIGKNYEGNTARAFFNIEKLPTLAENDVMLSTQLHTYYHCLDSDDDTAMPKAYSVAERWDTDSITWNYQPTYSDEEKEYKTHGEDGIFASVEWDISKEALAYYDGEQSHGIAFTSSDEAKEGTVYFPTGHGGELCPYILVSYINIPQSSSEDETESSDTVDNAVSNEPEQVEESGNDYDLNSNSNQSASPYGVVLPPIVDRTFKEITSELKIEYCTTSKDVWTALPSGKDVANLCGVRISTDNSKFYLQYKSKNIGKGWLDPVYSTKSGVYDYAGLAGHAMTHLSIEVYAANGTRIYDDYVVMYRAKVAGKWLEWVSNGWPDIMQTLKSEYGLSGDLDTAHTNAGWEALGNIQGLEIRMFERIDKNSGSSGGSSAPIEAGDFQLASGITMKYRNTGSNTWTTFGVSDTVSFSSIDGIMLETQGKEYYFRYAAKDATTGWNPFVSSSDANENDHANGYAGYKGRPITNISIEVHTADSRIYDDYIVIYRAKSGGMWLPWVSNGWPDIMETLMPGADLDTKSTDAGDGRYGPIQALEIRVYERKGLDPTPSKNAKIIDNVPYINQKAIGMPNGCESVSTVMALQKIGIDISPDTFVDRYLSMGSIPYWKNGVRYGFDPNKEFGGNPRRADGWGCFAPVIMKALNKFSDSCGFTATNVSGTSLSALCSNYIDKDIPVIMWGTVGMTSGYTIHNWITSEGTSVSYNSKLHCLLLVGYDENNYFFNDPLAKKTKGYSKARVEAAYAALGKQAIVIKKESSASGGPTVGPLPDQRHEYPIKYPKYLPLPDEHIQDPIDLSTGAHVIDHTLMTVSGAQELSFNISYSSNLLTQGAVGRGWTNNYHKRLVYDDKNDIIKVYDSPAYYAEYKRTNKSSNVYTSDTITKENYTVTKTATWQGPLYTVNCNYSSTEYYNAAGQLTKITSKSGFNTLLSYTDSTVTVTDEISGKYIILGKNSDNKIISVTDNTGRTCTLGYIDGNLVSITDENGNTLTYQYTKEGQIERGRDQNGTIYFTDTYDSVGRVIRQKDAVEGSAETVINYDDATVPNHLLVSVTDRTMRTTVYKYNDKKQLVSKTDSNGVEIKYEYDGNGNLTKKTDGLGNSAVNVYDSKNNLVSSTDKLGNKTEFTYDARNNLTKIKYPNGGTVTNTYDAKDRLTTSTDLRGVVTTYEYNDQNLLTKTSASDRTVTYAYTNGQPTTVTDPLGRATTKVYNGAGFLTSVTDAQDNTTSYTYDNKGNMLTVTDPVGNVATKEYDAGGNLVKSTDAKGNVTSYTYNGNLKMTSMTLPNGATVLYEYDGEDRLVKTIYPDETTAENTYDAGGRLIKQIDRDGNATEYEYDAAGNIIKTTNAEGGVTLKEYDAGGNAVKTTVSIQPSSDTTEDAQESVTQYVYDISGRLIKTVSPTGGETVYEYNNAGDLLSVTDALNNTTTNTYDSFGNLLTVTDPRGNTTSYTYDKLGNLLTVTNALGQVTTNTYDSMNRLVSTKDPGDHVVSYEYDALGRMIKQTDAKGNAVTQEYDALGNVVKITNASGHVDYQAVYNSMSKITEQIDAAGIKTTNEYDWAGNLTKQTDALGNSSSYTYNSAGQMISSVDKAGNVSYTTYDGMGNITSMTDPGGSAKTYSYDTAGRMLERKATGDKSEKCTYNAAGLLSYKHDAKYKHHYYTYDAAGRILSESIDTNPYGKTEIISYTYDANGNVLTVSDTSGTVTREYDALNRVSKYTDKFGNTVEYEYDACGNLSEMKYPNGDVGIYTYDANHNMLKSSLGEDILETVYEYNVRNQITKVTMPDGSWESRSYDSAGRLQIKNSRTLSGKMLFVYIYTYDSLGRIATELEAITMTEYTMTYDEMGRLTNRHVKDRNGEYDESFIYDPAGNIITSSGWGPDYEYTYGKYNKLSRINEKGLVGIDDAGNTTFYYLDGTAVDLRYDERNRLMDLTHGYGSYGYDAENNRTYADGVKYIYDTSDGRNRVAESIDGEGNVTIYGYGADGLVWSKSGDEYMVYHYDYRGSVVAVTDKDSNITDTLRYDAYGNTINRTGNSKLIFGYNGQYGVQTDKSGYLYMRTRYYSPKFKRFLSADVIDGSIADSTTLNLYAYVNGNPISFVDPFGLSAERGQLAGPLIDVSRLSQKEVNGKLYYDYTDVIMQRINEVLPEFTDHMIYSYEDYINKFSVKLFGEWVISVPSWDDYIAHVLGNMLFFYDNVATGHPWDVKLDGPWCEQFGTYLLMPYYYPGHDDKNMTFIFREELVTRDNLGNIIYGYLGSAMGLGETTLRWGGGLATSLDRDGFYKTVKKLLNGEINNDPTFGDNSGDGMDILKGTELFFQDYPNAYIGFNEVLPW